MASGNRTAHLSSSLSRSAAVMPASDGGKWRWLPLFTPQAPTRTGPGSMAVCSQRGATSAGAAASSCPERYSATASRSSRFRVEACGCMMPSSMAARMTRADMSWSMVFSGAFFTAPPWQAAQ